MLTCIWTGIVSQQYSAIFACLIKNKKKMFLHIYIYGLKYSRTHSVWLKTQRTGKAQKQYTVQRMICILKTGKIWYGFGTVPSGIINTFQPLLCSSHIMLWQASTPPARPLIFTHTTPTHAKLNIYSCFYIFVNANLLLNHLQFWYRYVPFRRMQWCCALDSLYKMSSEIFKHWRSFT